MDHNNFNASSSTKTEEIIKEQAAAQEKSCCSNDNATPSAPACCCTMHTDRSEADRKKLINRLKRIEGQIRGIIGMLENDATATISSFSQPPLMPPSILLTKNFSRIISVPVWLVISAKVKMKPSMSWLQLCRN